MAARASSVGSGRGASPISASRVAARTRPERGRLVNIAWSAWAATGRIDAGLLTVPSWVPAVPLTLPTAPPLALPRRERTVGPPTVPPLPPTVPTPGLPGVPRPGVMPPPSVTLPPAPGMVGVPATAVPAPAALLVAVPVGAASR